MIYELVDNCLASLANRWRDLSTAFQQLATNLPAADPRRPELDNPIGAPDPNRGLIQISSDEQARIEAWRIANQNLRPALVLFQQATQVFQDSDVGAGTVGVAGWIPGRTWVRGEFEGAFPPSAADIIEITFCRTQLEQLREFVAGCLQEFEEVTSPEGQRFSLSGIRGSVENIASYPMLTSDLAMAGPSLPSPPATGGTVPLQRTIEGALREVLGRMPKPNDPRSFVAALNQSFEIHEIEGHTEFKWTPRSYAGQTELGGGVTGAQASLYTRAKVALDNSLPLLDGLYPLLPDADPQEVEAARAILRSEFAEVVNELGIEGGPRVARVEALFDLLLVQDTTGIGGHIVPGGKLGYLEYVFGLQRDQVNTLEEEQDVTNFTALHDYIAALRQAWTDFRTLWFGRDLGTRLVLLSRALSVTAESVEEIYAAMDSVFVGPAERQVASFRDAGGQSILVEELLSWVVSFASDEAPRLVHEGGRRGVETIVPTAETLERLVRRFIESIPNEPSLPDGLRHPRVRHPLQELRGYLRQIVQLSQAVMRP